MAGTTVPTHADKDLNATGQPQFAQAWGELLDTVSEKAAVGWCRLRMSRFLGYQKERGQFFANLPELAEVMKCSRSKAYRIITELERAGWVHVPRRGVLRRDGSEASVYVLTLGPKEAGELKNRYEYEAAAQRHPRVRNGTQGPVVMPRVRTDTPPVSEMEHPLEGALDGASLREAGDRADGAVVVASQQDSTPFPDYSPASEVNPFSDYNLPAQDSQPGLSAVSQTMDETPRRGRRAGWVRRPVRPDNDPAQDGTAEKLTGQAQDSQPKPETAWDVMLSLSA
jgi:DNA-binding MarR family transcriptional regulator